MSVSVRFSGDVEDLLTKQDKVKESAAKVREEYKAWMRQIKELDDAHKRFNKESMTDQDRYNHKIDELKKLWSNGRISADQYHDAVQRAQSKLHASTQTGTKLFTEFATTAATSITSALTATSLLQTAIDGVNASHERALAIAARGMETNDQIKSFMAQQPEGMRQQRFQEVIAAAGGMLPPGEAANVAQGLYSSSRAGTEVEKFAQTIATIREMNTAFARGLSGTLSGEVATQAMNLKMDPAGLIRAVVAAGDTSSRDAKDIAPTAASWRLFQDRMMGVAVSSTLAEADPGTAKNAAESVAKTLTAAGEQFKDLRDWFESNGLKADASQSLRLSMMRKRGIDTPEELINIGVREDVAVRSLTTVLQQFGHMREILQGARGAYADPAFLQDNVAGLRAEVPSIANADEIRRMESEQLATDALNIKSQREKMIQQRLYKELQKSGLEDATLVGPLFEADGSFRGGRTNYLWNQILEKVATAGFGSYQVERQAIELRVTQEVDRRLAEMQRGKPTVQKQEH